MSIQHQLEEIVAEKTRISDNDFLAIQGWTVGEMCREVRTDPTAVAVQVECRTVEVQVGKKSVVLEDIFFVY